MLRGRSLVMARVGRWTDGNGRAKNSKVPKLSAAMTTPSLNFMARTEVPVTAGDWVWVLGPCCR